jgi:carboxylesterase
MSGIKAEKLMPGAEPFFLPAGETGCLLIHGISGSPQVFRAMGDYLAGRGITCYGVLLKGHGTRVEAMHSCTYRDWVSSAEEGLNILRDSCSTIFCSGLSMGGIIAVRLARMFPEVVRGVIPICSPYRLRSFKFRLVPLLKNVIKTIPAGTLSINDPRAVQVNYKHHSIPAVHELIRLTALLRRDLPRVRQPALIFAARQDKTVDCRDPLLYLSELGSEDKELIWLENSQHVATLDFDKEVIYEKSLEFISRVRAG